MNRFKPQIDATAFNYPSVAAPYRTRESPAADGRFSLVETCHESHGRDGGGAGSRGHATPARSSFPDFRRHARGQVRISKFNNLRNADRSARLISAIGVQQ